MGSNNNYVRWLLGWLHKAPNNGDVEQKVLVDKSKTAPLIYGRLIIEIRVVSLRLGRAFAF